MLKEIAEALRISVRQVTNLKVQGMPTHSVDAAVQWRKEQRAGGDTDEKLKQARIEKIAVETEIKQIELDLANGRSISRTDCKEAWTRLGSAVCKALQMAAKEIPQVCLGLPISQALPLSKAKMSEIQRMLSDHESEFWNNHKEIEEQ